MVLTCVKQTNGALLACVKQVTKAGMPHVAAFALIEQRVADPMCRLSLFRIGALTAGSLLSRLASIGRGGL